MERNTIRLITDKYKQMSIQEHGMSIEWEVENFEKVEKGQLLAYANVANFQKTRIPIYSMSNGYCQIVLRENTKIPLVTLGYILNGDKTSFPNIPNEKIDEFSGTLNIVWEKIGGFNAIGIPLTHNSADNLYLSATYKNNKICLDINFISKYLKLKKGDTISFKFSDGKIIDFTIGARPVSVLSPIHFPEDGAGSVYKEALYEEFGSWFSDRYDYVAKRKTIKKVSFFLSRIDLQSFIQRPIESYRITYNSEGGASIDDVPYNLIMASPICQEVIQDLFRVLAESVSKYDSSYDLANLNTEQVESDIEVEFDYCYVYLMHDTNTGYYKIGMSNNPTYREGTLQSEKPTIEMLACHKYPSRKFAAAIESALHNVYKDLHVRGEWYKLSKEDVAIIKEGLK